jgi:hypothetical protein
MARKNAIVSVAVNDGYTGFTVSVDGHDPLLINANNLSDEVRNRAVIHGLVQKISDAAALGKDATPADKYNAMKAVVDRLHDGDWSKRGDGNGDGQPAGIIFRAFHQFIIDASAEAGRDAPAEETVRALYDKKTRSEQLALRNDPRIAAIMETLRAAKVKTSSVDLDSLFAELAA